MQTINILTNNEKHDKGLNRWLSDVIDLIKSSSLVCVNYEHINLRYIINGITFLVVF